VTVRLEPPDEFGPTVSNVAEVTGGARGPFGGRGGHRNLRAEGGTASTQSAVDFGLEWLQNHQSSAGGWDADGFDVECRLNRCSGRGHPDADPAITGLALLAFTGAGETHRHGRYTKTIGRALAWLVALEDRSGAFGAMGALGRMNQALPTQALAEAWALTGSADLRDAAARGLDYLAANAGDGEWTEDDRRWTAFALFAAKAAGFAVDGDLLARVDADLKAIADGGAPSGPPPAADDVVAWHFGALAAFRTGGEEWKAWNEAMKKALVETQRMDGDERGSWDPTGPDAALLGRVGTTALAVATLEVYYRYAR
jgi:hypothetical protein